MAKGTGGRAFTRRAMMTGAAVMAALGLPAFLPAGLSPRSQTAQESILAALSDARAASLVGQMALASWPHLRDPQFLLERILSDLQIGAGDAARTARGEMRQRLSQAIQSDFAAARTVKLDGWLLAVTEAHLCALAALDV